MLLPGTNAELGVIIIAGVECLMLFFQLIYYFERPADKSRLLFLLLLLFLIQYNLAGSLLPDKRLGIPVIYQYVYTYFTGISMSMYIIFYFYKAFDLKRLKRIALYGMVLYVALPYVFLFAIPYSITGNFSVYNKLVVVVPSLYAFIVGMNIYRALRDKYKDSSQNRSVVKEEIIVISATFLFWLSMPVVTYFEGPQLLEHGLTNIGFFLLAGSYIRSAIRNSHKEYEELLAAKNRLENINDDLTEKVKERTKSLEKANERQAFTFENLVHRIKTPLTLMNNYLSDYRSRYGSNEDLQVVESNLKMLTRDVNNLFDVQRHSKGLGLYKHEQTADFSQIVRENLLLFQQFFQMKKMAVKADDIIDNANLQADPAALDAIVKNLIENAIKYTPAGGEIIVQLELCAEKICFMVADNGIGIPLNMQKKVFEPYFQINAPNGSFQGMGLGLPLVKKIVAELNGEIRLISTPHIKKGTQFIIELPAKQLTDSQESAEAFKTPDSALSLEVYTIDDTGHDERKKTILLVEDNRQMANYLVKKLSERYNVWVAFNGMEALQKLQQKPIPPDLILSDVMMDKVDGFKFGTIISENPAYSHIPFIFLSAKATGKDKLQGLRLGAIDYVEKPFGVDELRAKIQSILENADRSKTLLVKNAVKALTGKAVGEPVEPSADRFEGNCKAYGFTSREIDVARLIGKGYTYKQIGDTLYISEKTVESHIRKLFEKTGVSKASQLVSKLQAGH